MCAKGKLLFLHEKLGDPHISIGKYKEENQNNPKQFLYLVGEIWAFGLLFDFFNTSTIVNFVFSASPEQIIC